MSLLHFEGLRRVAARSVTLEEAIAYALEE